MGLDNLDIVGSHTSSRTISSASGITAPTGSSAIIMQAITQNVRYTIDGSTPTTTEGFQLKAGDPPVMVPLGFNASINVIQEAPTAVLSWQWVNHDEDKARDNIIQTGTHQFSRYVGKPLTSGVSQGV